jgi:hypothetical protein
VHRVRFVILTNGLRHFCWETDHQRGDVRFLPQLPTYAAMLAR